MYGDDSSLDLDIEDSKTIFFSLTHRLMMLYHYTTFGNKSCCHSENIVVCLSLAFFTTTKAHCATGGTLRKSRSESHLKNMKVWNVVVVLSYASIPCLIIFSPPKGLRRDAGDASCLLPVWNLRAFIWFHFTISSLVLLPSYCYSFRLVFFSACM